MFEIGKQYDIHEHDGAGTTHMSRVTVVDWQPPLLQIRHGDNNRILNTGSSLFHSAHPFTQGPASVDRLAGSALPATPD